MYYGDDHELEPGMSPLSRWQVLFAAGGGLFVVVGWQLLPSPLAALLLALGGGFFGVALAPRLWRDGPSKGPADAERLEETITTFQEGMLDLYSLVELGRTISASLDLDQLFTTTMKRVADTTGVESYALFLHDETMDKLARAIAQSKAYSIAGGGDTVAAINKLGIAERVDYISTAGGAFLEFLEGKTLPAVAALEARAER